VRARPVRRHGRTLIPLTQRPGGPRAYKMLLSPAEPEAELRTDEGYEWMHVLSGRVPPGRRSAAARRAGA
jgi:hypothetical protein